ncbi:sensor histidine kinase N-terminal domain-containing protein [Mesobaculum littorinae]|uniref:sensor histidine kinase N-terminal domain-containing protein n=1 Tax=Mesobaculum littorinae TaxID=2486419 RepID=UPI001F22E9BE|nr:sensor histidine kinase N-terminal domain-containing protein [Mesobaculum littorinae]
MAVAVAAVVLVGGAVVLATALAYGRHAAREAYDRLLVGAASDIAESITIRDGTPEVDMPVSAFELLSLARKDRIAYRVIDRAGRTLTGDAAAPAPETLRDLSLYSGAFGDEPARYAAVVRRFAERGYSGPVQIIVGHTLRARQELARDIAQNALAVLGAAGAAIALFASLAVASAMRPLTDIGAALARRDPTDLTPLRAPAPREIAALRDALNAFMARLDRQLRANRDLISNAAHQLRTPLAAIRVQLEAAADDPDPARKEALLTRVHERSRAYGRLLDQLLSQGMVLHRADAIAKERMDLRDAALEIYEQSDIEVFATGLRLRLDLPDDPVTVEGDLLSLTEAGKNLLTNALRHGTPPIALGVARTGGEARLWVRDAGPGPAPGVLKRIGDRFARDGLSRDGGAPGGVPHTSSSAAGRSEGSGSMASDAVEPKVGGSTDRVSPTAASPDGACPADAPPCGATPGGAPRGGGAPQTTGAAMGGGLGLSIAQTVADNHGGRLSHGTDAAGFEIAMILPVAPA